MPIQFDWRKGLDVSAPVVDLVDQEPCKRKKRDVLAPVVNQEPCDCCWAIVTANSITSARSIRFGYPIEMYSYQQLVDCTLSKWAEEPGNECMLTCYREAYKYVRDNGLSRRRDYPWEKRRGRCRKHLRYDVLQDYENIGKDDEEEMLKAIEKQPIAACIDLTEKLYYFRGDGIFNEPAPEKTHSHAVLIVGYGEDEGVKYFIIQNSLGRDWGVQGFGKVNRSLFRLFSYPLVKEGYNTKLIKS